MVFRLADALPSPVLAELNARRPGDRIVAAEGCLDAGVGSRALAEPPVAGVVATALAHFDGQRYRLHAWCIMPSHVHVLAAQAEGWPLPDVVHAWKSFSAKAINRRLDRHGHFWAANYFDRFMRDEAQFEAARAYIEANPVKAGLCGADGDWPWSSATGR